ncbi:MAG: hypothetical protein K9G49_09830 [Taibaiella sp.]|nr:hypothetical protein [Taibaiella sp.]
MAKSAQFLRNQAITKQNDCKQKSGLFTQNVNPLQDEAKKRWEKEVGDFREILQAFSPQS